MEPLAIITPSWFIEVDLPVVRALSSYYHIHWIIVFQKDLREYSPADVIRHTGTLPLTLHIVQRRYRRLHPHNFFVALYVVRKIASVSGAPVYFNTLEDMYLLLLVRLMFRSSRIIVGVHDFIPHRRFSTRLIRFTHQIVYRAFRNFHFFSETQRKAFLKQYPGKITWMIPMFLKDYGSPKQIENSSSDRYYFLFFGQIRYNKGIDILVEAVNILGEKSRNFKVVIAGSGAEAGYYQQKVRFQDCIKWDIRVIPDTEIPGLFAHADFVVLPYRDVTQSGPLWIAFRYNIPAIVTDLPGFREWVIEGATGLFAPPENPEALAETMYRALTMPHEEKVRMKQNIEKFVQHTLNRDALANAYRKMFSQLS